MFAVHKARTLRRGNQILLSSKSPLSIAADFKDDEIEVVCNVESGSTVTLFVGKKPVRVLLGGQELNPSAFSFNAAEGAISLYVPNGQHDVKIMFR
jgi:hypothetical protein